MARKPDKRERSVRLSYQPREATMLRNLNIRIDAELFDLIREAAALDKRPVSQWVRVVIEEAAQMQVRRHEAGAEVK